MPVNVAQARVIVQALDRLPTSGEFAVDADQRARAERHLVDLAEHYDAKALAVLGRKLFEVIAPDLAEAYEAKVLADQEAAGSAAGDLQHAGGRRRHRPRPVPDPVLPRPGAGQDADGPDLTGPAHRHRHRPDLPTDVRHGQAFCQLIEAIPGKSLPKAGGCGATIVVTMTLEQLLADLETAGVCTLDTGGHLTAAEARRLACAAGIIPAVLGGRSQPLDLGRRRRLHTEAQRLALGLRDHGCTTDGCEQPPARVPRPPRHPLEPRRTHRPHHRPTPLRAPPPTHPRPPLRPRTPAQRQGHLPPTPLRGRARATTRARTRFSQPRPPC